MKYELTITLKPQLYQFPPQKQFDLSSQILWHVLLEFVEVSAVAELTSTHNIHYHCVISLEDLRHKDRLLNRFRPYCKVFGRSSCSQIMYEDSYINYMRKDLEKTKQIIKDPIVRDSFGIFKTIF